MVPAFQPGERLTAQKLNAAFAGSREGLANPSDSYNWRRTQYGDLQTAWDSFGNTKNVNPSPLDVEVCVDPLQSPVTLPGGEKLGAVRRVFMNAGTPTLGAVGQESPNGIYWPWGRMNDQTFLGLVGMQRRWEDSPLGGDGSVRFSLFSQDVVPASDTPSAWAAAEKLWQYDVARNSNQNRWWWTGLTMEDMPASALSANYGTEIVVWPVVCTYRTAGGPALDQAVLMVTTRWDYERRESLLSGSAPNVLGGLINSNYMGRLSATLDWFRFTRGPGDSRVVASYEWSPNTTNAHYKQQTNYVDFRRDFSESTVEQYVENGTVPLLNGLQCVDPDGVHLDLVPRGYGFPITDLSGNAVPADWNTQYFVAVGLSGDSPVPCCVSCDATSALYSEDGPIQYCLSGLGDNDQGVTDWRLVLIDPRGAQGPVYFDKCPDFSGGGKGKFHFEWTPGLSGGTPVGAVGEGAVQIGGYTYFSAGGSVPGLLSGTRWVCVEVGLTSPPTIGFKAFPDLSALNSAQGDHAKYVFPLYRTVDGQVDMDYRPLPNAGCWEVAEGGGLENP